MVVGILLALTLIYFFIAWNIDAWWEECDGKERRRSERGDG